MGDIFKIKKYKSNIKFPKFNNFKEFCDYVNTPEEVAEYYMQSGIIWPPDGHSDCPFYWPDDIIKKNMGNCFDHAIFMCYFCHLKKIEHYMQFIGSLEKIDGIWRNNGHVRAIFKNSNGYYIFEPNIAGRNETDRCLFGPFDSLDEIKEFCVDIWRRGGEIQFGSKVYVRYRVLNENELKIFYSSIGKNIKSRDVFYEKHFGPSNSEFIDRIPSDIKEDTKDTRVEYDINFINKIINFMIINFSFIKLKFRKKFDNDLIYNDKILPIDIRNYNKNDSRVLCFNPHKMRIIGSSLKEIGRDIIKSMRYNDKNFFSNLLLDLSIVLSEKISDIYALDFVSVNKDQVLTPDLSGFPVLACSAGKVEKIYDFKSHKLNLLNRLSDNLDSYGNCVLIRHDDDTFSFYAHLENNSICVSNGENVSAGQKIANVGNTGDCSIPKLHFAILSSKTLTYGSPIKLSGFKEFKCTDIGDYFTAYRKNEFKKKYNEKMNYHSGELSDAFFITESLSNNYIITESLKVRGMYFKKSIDNYDIGIIDKNEKSYRPRSEIIILDDEDRILLLMQDEINQYGNKYKLPGGGFDSANESPEEVAIREASEEVRIIPKNVILYPELTYISEYGNRIPEWHKIKLWPAGIKYSGAISFVCVGRYGKKYNKYVKVLDRDANIDNYKFYDIEEVKNILSDVHIKAINKYLNSSISRENYIITESLSNNSKTNIIPIDLNYEIDDETRWMCLNTHVINYVYSRNKAMNELKEKFNNESLFGKLSMIPDVIKDLFNINIATPIIIKDQYYAFDFFTIGEDLQETDKMFSGDKCPVLSTDDGIVVCKIYKNGEFESEHDEFELPYEIKTNIMAFGNAIIIEHQNGSYYSAYCHLTDNSFKVNVGDHVSSGDIIALLGNTGNSSGPHLHFELFSTIFNRPLPKKPDNFKDYYYTKIDINQNSSKLSEFYDDVELNTVGTLEDCYLSDPPDKIYKEQYEILTEDVKKYKNSKIRTFDEFCDICKTPEDTMDWFKANKVEWGKALTNRTPMIWPDELIKTKTGICFDQSIFMHFFFDRKKIEHRLALFNLKADKGKFVTGHIYPIYKKKDYYYIWGYLAPGYGEIFGPFYSYEDAAEKFTSYFLIALMRASKKHTDPINWYDWSIIPEEDLSSIDKYYNKPINQDELMLANGAEMIWHTHMMSYNFRWFTIPRPAALFILTQFYVKKAKNFLKKDNPSEIIKESSEEIIPNKINGICDYVLTSYLEDLDLSEFNAIKSGRRFMYTKATVMAKDIPLVVFLSYCEGLTTVLRKARIKNEFSDKRPKFTGIESSMKGVVQFADGYLIYDKYPLENSLLMNGLYLIETKNFTYTEMDSKEVYINLFDILYNNRALANALNQFYEFMIDPVTLTVLEDLNYPTDFVSLLLAGNILLADNSFTEEISMDNYRIRNNEMVYAYAYKRITDAYGNFARTANNKNPAKISIPQSGVLTDIMQSQIVDDVSELSPIFEVEKTHILTDKGPSGTNLKEAYNERRRCYDKSMVGVVAISQSPDANVGITRTMTLNPNIVNARGFVKDKKSLKEANVYCAAELLTPGAMSHDDQIRGSMATKQSKHIIPVSSASPILISNGSEKVLPYHLSDDFCVVAKADGKVISNNPKTGVIVIEYKEPVNNKKRYVINSNTKVVKNGAGGFYLTKRLNCDDLKPGYHFKKNDILAYDDKFFSKSNIEGVRFNIGTLVKAACFSTYSSFEDGCFITEKLSKKMGSEICMESEAVIGKNSNVSYVVKIGDKVNVGDPLIIFDNSSNDESFNKMLKNIGKELKEEITLMGKTPIKSKYAGEIQDIRIYATVKTSEMSSSLKKLVEDYYSRIRSQENDIKKNAGSDPNLAFTESTNIIENEDGKVMGVTVGEGILIKFFIKYIDQHSIGELVAYLLLIAGNSCLSFIYQIYTVMYKWLI